MGRQKAQLQLLLQVPGSPAQGKQVQVASRHKAWTYCVPGNLQKAGPGKVGVEVPAKTGRGDRIHGNHASVPYQGTWGLTALPHRSNYSGDTGRLFKRRCLRQMPLGKMARAGSSGRGQHRAGVRDFARSLASQGKGSEVFTGARMWILFHHQSLEVNKVRIWKKLCQDTQWDRLEADRSEKSPGPGLRVLQRLNW